MKSGDVDAGWRWPRIHVSICPFRTCIPLSIPAKTGSTGAVVQTIDYSIAKLSHRIIESAWFQILAQCGQARVSAETARHRVRCPDFILPTRASCGPVGARCSGGPCIHPVARGVLPMGLRRSVHQIAKRRPTRERLPSSAFGSLRTQPQGPLTNWSPFVRDSSDA